MATKSAKLIKDNTNLKGKLKDTDQKKHKKKSAHPDQKDPVLKQRLKGFL